MTVNLDSKPWTNLLVARYRIVPYLDRGDILKGALDWALRRTGSDARGRLYVAPGGYGKTRFAIELVLALVDRGWACTFLSDRNTRNLAPGALQETVAGAGVPGRLVVLDYAESQIALLKGVASAAAAASAAVPLRILALARSPEGWWHGTRADPDVASIFEPAPLELLDTPLDKRERQSLFSAGVDAFRRALVEADLPSVAVSRIRGPEIGNLDRPLTVAMIAFLTARGAPFDADDSLFERVFVEERRHWQRVLHIDTDNDPILTSLHRAAAQVTLVQGATVAGVAALIGADPRAVARGLSGQEKTAAALQTIYGDHEDGVLFLRPIEPDLLGEYTAMMAVKDDTYSLLCSTFITTANGYPLFDTDVAAILTVLARATRPEHDQIVRNVAMSSLREVSIVVKNLDRIAIRRVEAGLPRFSLLLIEVSLAVSRRIVETSDSPDEEARALNNYAISLRNLGYRRDALEAAKRAVELFDTLVRDQPEIYRSGLATSLGTLGSTLSDAGEREEALESARRAVEIGEALADAELDAPQTALATALNNLANRLNEAGRKREAIKAATRAVEIYEALVRDNPESYLPDLALTLNNYSCLLSEVGDFEKALSPIYRAVEIREKLTRDYPDTYKLDLASSLSNLANRLRNFGKANEALEPAHRAVELYKEFMHNKNDAYQFDLGMSLGTLGDVFKAQNNLVFSLEIYSDSLAAFCSSFPSAPGRFGRYVWMTAKRIEIVLIDLGRASEIEPKLRGIMGDELYEAWRDSRSDRPEVPSPETPDAAS